MFRNSSIYVIRVKHDDNRKRTKRIPQGSSNDGREESYFSLTKSICNPIRNRKRIPDEMSSKRAQADNRES